LQVTFFYIKTFLRKVKGLIDEARIGIIHL
jgi:hypothetical protein